MDELIIDAQGEVHAAESLLGSIDLSDNGVDSTGDESISTGGNVL